MSAQLPIRYRRTEGEAFSETLSEALSEHSEPILLALRGLFGQPQAADVLVDFLRLLQQPKVVGELLKVRAALRAQEQGAPVEWLSVRQLAVRLKCSPSTVERRLREFPELAKMGRGRGNRREYPWREFERYWKDHSC